MRVIQDLTGLVFGKWTVVSRAIREGDKETLWSTRCECGNTGVVGSTALRNGHSPGCKTCGQKRSGKRTHGQHSSSTYKSWRAMLNRCNRPATAGYANYGGRGITVCEQWKKFEVFLADVGARPAGFTLDRINSNGNYEPGNVRWADSRTQGQNRCTVKLNREIAAEIRRLCASGMRQADIARKFSTTPASVCDIVHGRTWKVSE